MQRIALCLGVGTYKDANISNLACASRDAVEVRIFLEHRLRFDEVRWLTDAQVTSESVREALEHIGAKLKPGDVFVFFFAGHGKTWQNATPNADQLFLLPQVSSVDLKKQVLTGASGLLSWHWLKAITDEWHGVQRLFIFDACRSPVEALAMRDTHAQAQFEGAGVFRDVRLKRATHPLAGAAAGCTIINSCGQGGQAEELPGYQGGGRGKFTAALLELWGSQAQAGQTVAVDEGMPARLSQRMLELDRQYGGSGQAQQPMLEGAAVVLAGQASSGQRVADLLDLKEAFEQHLRAGQLDAPAQACAQATLAQLQAADMPAKHWEPLQQRLVQALVARQVPPPQPPTPPVPPVPEVAAPVVPPVLPPVQPPPTAARNVVAVAVVVAVLGVVGGKLGWWGGKGQEAGLERPLASSQPEATTLLPPVAVEAKGPQVGQVERECVNGVCFELAGVPGGRFEMGSPATESGREVDEGPVHTVNVRGFWLGKTEVTQGLWKAVMGNNPSEFTQCGDECPVERVSWVDVQEFIYRLNELTGKKYRLPSEAEWEYAARAGTKTTWSFGEDESQLGDYAWFGGNSGGKTHPVGQKKPNPWGLYDMHGNVWEWVQDAGASNYNDAPVDGSAREGVNVGVRVFRGGSWGNIPQVLRSANRYGYTPDYRYGDLGLRLARTFKAF